MCNATVKDAQQILTDIGFQGVLTNERSATVFLALAGLDESKGWGEAQNPLLRIHDMIESINAGCFEKEYRENSRETIRDETITPYVDAGLVLKNPDEDRPVTSPNTCYALPQEIVDLLQAFGSSKYSRELARVKSIIRIRGRKNAVDRELTKGHVVLPDGETILQISEKGQGLIIKAIIEEFLPLYAPDCEVLYISDSAGDIFLIDATNKKLLSQIQEAVSKSSASPDLIAWMPKNNWLYVCEACSSGGPINEARREILLEMLESTGCGLIFTTCFSSRIAMKKWLPELAWETEAWCAEDPTHMIHLDGERFLGPYK